MTSLNSLALTPLWCLPLLLLTFLHVTCHQDLDSKSLLLDETVQEIEHQQTAAKKCIPMLNLASQFSPTASRNVTKSNEEQTPTSTFAVADMDLPITPPGGSVNSAMRLLSVFDKQLVPGGYEDPTTDDHSAAVDQLNVVKFRQNKLHIQGLNLTMMNVHLYTQSEPRFALGVTIKNTSLSGQFSYNGPAILSDSTLSGYYRMSIDSILLTASSNLTKQMQEPSYRLVTNDFKMNISNLGYISLDIFDSQNPSRPTNNYWLKMLQRILQKTIKRTYYSVEHNIRQALEVEAKRFLDCELTRFTPILSNTTQANNNGSEQQWNELADIINSEILNSHLDQVSLPNFDYQRTILGTEASIFFTNGSLSGLDHIKLNNDTRIKLQNEHLLINASLGWSDLRPTYDWSLFVGANSSRQGAPNRTPMSRGFVAFNIKRVDFDAVISKGLGHDTKLQVDELIIRRLDNPKMDIGGLPGMNRVARGLVNFFMGRLKQRLVLSIQPALKQQLERTLNRLHLFGA